MRVLEMTDPACPVAFSAEPARRRIAWLYGSGLEWQRVMVVLNDGSGPVRLPPVDVLTAARTRLREAHGMPLRPEPADASPGSLHATRLVVAARLRSPSLEAPLLRALRVLAMSGVALERDAVEELGRSMGAEEAVAAMDDPDVEEAVRADMAAARDVTPAGRALGHRLSRDGSRYSTPSYRYVSSDGTRAFELVGIHPPEAHEAVIANLDPSLPRRDDPSSVEEVLSWAGEPLAAAEVAAVMGVSRDEAASRLDDAGGVVERDGYYALG